MKKLQEKLSGVSSVIGNSISSGTNVASFTTPDMPDTSDYSQSISAIPTIRPSWHQLIIIGNDFDLECGLPSGFDSFVSARQKAFSRSESEGEIQFTKTVWDVILDGVPNANWCDIEGAIAEWVAPTGKKPLSRGAAFAR